MRNFSDIFARKAAEVLSGCGIGVEGADKIREIMRLFRNSLPEKIGEFKINKSTDYMGETPLPKSDVLYFELDNGVDFVIRPSGTEPKVKIYYLSSGKTYEDAKQKAEYVKKAVTEIMVNSHRLNACGNI